MRTYRWIIAGAVAVALAGCGSDEVASPGSGGNITINNPPPTNPDPNPNPNPNPNPQDPNLAQPAASCPATDQDNPLRDDGTITGPTGTYRVCTLPNNITRSVNLPRTPGVLYALDGRVNVGPDRGAAPTADAPVVLTIQPGAVIFAKTGTSWLAVNRGNRINAIGTAARPIVFTSQENVLGTATDDSQGQWGGVVLMGRAPITDCRVTGATPGSVDCYRETEGSVDTAAYGGATPDDDSGTLTYVQIRYSGYVLSANSELQALTLEGVGSATEIDHIQMHNSSDDGFENFGGRAHMRRIVVTGADDDSIDLDVGYQGTLQYVLAIQKTSGNADSIIELDSANTLEHHTPRTHMKLANFTFVHRNAATANTASMLFRGKADATLVNGVVTVPDTLACLRLHGTGILTADPAIQKLGPPVFRSVVMQCSATPFVGSDGVTPEQVAAVFAGPNNSAAFTASLASTFVNGASETAVVATDPKTLDPAFDTTTYVGAVRDASDTWYAGWTCNSATADFGSTSTACTSLPTLAD
jgi:hypothetical protein